MELFNLTSFGPLIRATFLARPNRFVGHIDVKGRRSSCHVADTGRLKEILTPGRPVLVSRNPGHFKTDYRLLAARMETWVLINTGIHSRIVRRALKHGILGFQPVSLLSEVPVDGGRLDHLVNDTLYIEVKGTNLLINGQCRFPDAPTARGTRHLEALMRLVDQGNDAMVLLLGLRDGTCFCPNDDMDPDFAATFRSALRHGVQYRGFKLAVNAETGLVSSAGPLPLCPEVLNG